MMLRATIPPLAMLRMMIPPPNLSILALCSKTLCRRLPKTLSIISTYPDELYFGWYPADTVATCYTSSTAIMTALLHVLHFESRF
jgi:hypothetical protein